MRKTLMCALLALAGLAHGEPAKTQPAVDNVVVRAMPKVAPASAAFLTLHNPGQQAITLIGADSPVANSVELHNHTMMDGMMAMRRIDEVSVAPGETVTFQPGGLHIMLIGLKQDLVDGSRIPLTLKFSDGSEITVTASVGPVQPAQSHMHHH